VFFKFWKTGTIEANGQEEEESQKAPSLGMPAFESSLASVWPRSTATLTPEGRLAASSAEPFALGLVDGVVDDLFPPPEEDCEASNLDDDPGPPGALLLLLLLEGDLAWAPVLLLLFGEAAAPGVAHAAPMSTPDGAEEVREPLLTRRLSVAEGEVPIFAKE